MLQLLGRNQDHVAPFDLLLELARQVLLHADGFCIGLADIIAIAGTTVDVDSANAMIIFKMTCYERSHKILNSLNICNWCQWCVLLVLPAKSGLMTLDWRQDHDYTNITLLTTNFICEMHGFNIYKCTN